MKTPQLKNQFRLWTGSILFFLCLGVSIAVYTLGRSHAEESIYRETEIYIAAVDATRTYVKDVLRPKMWEIIPDEDFVIEAMSTSYVGREVMGRVHERFRNFNYKRASIAPLNPKSKADEFEAEKIAEMNTESGPNEWAGTFKRDREQYYGRLRAIRAEHECLRCHSGPDDAPPFIVERYGRTKGFADKLGQVVAVDAVYIPVDYIFGRIKSQAWLTFMLGTVLLFSLITLFYTLFNQTVISELKGLLVKFRAIGTRPEEADPDETARLDEFGQLSAALDGVALDLKHAHDELTLSESKYRRLFEGSRDPILIWDLDRRLVDINPAGVATFGFESRRKALAEREGVGLVWDSPEGEELFEAIVRDGFGGESELTIRNRRGEEREVVITATLRRDDHGRPVGVEGIVRDVTEKKAMSKNLARAEKLASVGMLAAGLAHEINNPLGVIKCYADLIENDVDETSAIKEDLEVIKKHVSGCRAVVDDLLNFSRVSKTDPQTAPPEADLEEVLAVLEPQLAKQGIGLVRDLDRDIPEVTVDGDKIRQVYMNLLLNARQAIESEGEIRVSTTFDEERRMVLVRIEDSGCGIPDHLLDKVFDPFFTTKETGHGTGLGLAVSYGIIKEHNGQITVESRVGAGTVFTIALPVV